MTSPHVPAADIMLKLALPVLSVVLLSGPVMADTTKMTCENPRRTYFVVFDAAAESFTLESADSVTAYRVNRIERNADGTAVFGKTVIEGPDFTAYLGTNKRIEFSDEGEIIQIDECRQSSKAE